MTEDLIPTNGFTFSDLMQDGETPYCWARELMRALGYDDFRKFEKVINRATKTCITLNIPHYENFRATEREIDGEKFQDFKLSLFACYLTVMNGDNKNPNVAAAQVYFAEQTRKFELYIQNHEEFERLAIREDLKEGNVSLQSTVKKAGVSDYARFHNAGYRGLYNMFNWELAKKRKIETDKLYDYMGRAELAANLFRITQTEERIKSRSVRGQQNLEQTHFDVGREVRDMVQRNVGRPPEALPQERKIPDMQKELKQGYKKMLAANKTKRPKSES